MKRFLIFFLFVTLLFILIFFFFGKSNQIPEGVVVGSGRIEGDDVELAPKVGGKVIKVLVDEGDKVAKNQVVAKLESTELEARRQEAVSALKIAEIKAKQAEIDYSVTRKKVKLALERAEEAYKMAIFNSLRAKADYEKYKKDYLRFKSLFRKGVISKRRFEEVERAFKVSEALYKSALKKVSIAEKSLQLAKADLKLIEIKKKAMDAAKGEVERIKHVIEQIDALIKDTEVISPIKGVVIEKLVEEGEVIARGTPVLVVVDLDSLYLKMFINEKDVGKISLGMPARIYVDAYPNEPFKAKVCFVAQKAEFTPKEVETVEERVHHVFAVKLCITRNSKGLLKPGMPASGVIKYKGYSWFNPITKEVVP